MTLNLMCVIACTVGAGLLASLDTLPGQAPPALRIARDLRIDAAEHDLSPVGWVAVAPNGTMAVSQPQDGLLRFFDARGTSLGTFGRKGRGPGEFTDPSRSAWIGDTLWVADFSTRRFTLVAPDRTLLRTVPYLQSVTVAAPGGETPHITSVFSRSLLSGGRQLATVNLADDSPWPGGRRSTQPFVRIDSAGVLQNVVAWHPGRAPCMVSARVGGAFMSSLIPFCAAPLDDVSSDGARYALAEVVGDGGSYRVSVMRVTGDTISSRTYSYAPVRISKAVADSVIARRIGRQTGPAADMWRSAKLPANYPPLARVVLGRDETVWLERFSISGDREWLMLDGQGSVAGRVTMPRGIALAVASRDQVWAIETDDDGLQQIVRYRVSR
jgi:hypothetical protein